MDSIAVIRRLHAHRAWSNRLLCDAARQLDDEALRRDFAIGQGSLLATLNHLYAAEHVWLDAIEGRQPQQPSHYSFARLAELESAWRRLEQRWADRLDSLNDHDLSRMVAKSSSETGKTTATPLVDVLLHVCTHARYTTAQAVNMLRQLDVVPPQTMLITLSRAEHDRSDCTPFD